MRDGKRAAVAVGLLVAFGIAGELVPRVASTALASGATASQAARARAPRPLLAASAAPARTETPTFAAPADTATLRRSRSDLAASASSPARSALPPAPPQAQQRSAAGGSFRILLEPLAPAPGAVTASFAGRDTGAPRALALWRVGAGRPQRLGRAHSDADAQIHGPQLALPSAGIELVVTPLGVRPSEPGASQPLRLARVPEDAAFAPAHEGLQSHDSPRWRHASLASSPEGDTR